MSEMEQGRKAGGSGKAFTTAVVLAIIACMRYLSGASSSETRIDCWGVGR